jgi:DNA repair exonuclease SbcCD ATPase subunit
MNEKKYKKKIESQNKIISRQSEQIDCQNAQIAKLKLEIEEKDNIINSVASLKDEFIQKNKDIDMGRKQLKELIDEVRKMKEIINQEVYRGRWWLVKFLIR